MSKISPQDAFYALPHLVVPPQTFSRTTVKVQSIVPPQPTPPLVYGCVRTKCGKNGKMGPVLCFLFFSGSERHGMQGFAGVSFFYVVLCYQVKDYLQNSVYYLPLCAGAFGFAFLCGYDMIIESRGRRIVYVYSLISDISYNNKGV